MERNTLADTALNLGAAVLGIGWIVGLAWSSRWPGWLQVVHTLVFVGGIYALGAIGQVRRERRMDEVQLAARRFGAQWGMFAGVALMVVLGLSSPFQELMSRWVIPTSDSIATMTTRMFLLGVTSTFVAQEISRVAMTAGWKWSKR
jgi:uncharacterized membrane protein YgdD (TMEM256/DUF423 family)